MLAIVGLEVEAATVDPVLSSKVTRRAVVMGVTFTALCVLLYLVAVRTPTGQRFEDAVLRAADGSRSPPVVDFLDTITAWSLAAMVAMVVAIGRFRGLPVLGFAAGGVIVGSVVTTELLRALLSRPLLLEHGYRREDQSFPSGHTTIAVSVMCSLVLVVPYRFRGAAVVLASLWAVGVEALTVTASWHRPSDTLGSDLIVLIYVCAVVVVLTWLGSVRSAEPSTGSGRIAWSLPAGLLGAGAVAALCTAVVLGHHVLCVLAAATDQQLKLGSALSAGQAIALAGGTLTALALLALLRGVDLQPPDREVAVSRRVDPPAEPTSPQIGHAR
jgi:membrane-associated phospholipid phosphatase